MRHLFNKHSNGFTIPELIITITVLTLLTPVVIFGLGNFYQDNITSLAKTTQDTDMRSALNTISNDLRTTTGFRASLNVASVTPLGSNNNATGNNNWSYCGIGTTVQRAMASRRIIMQRIGYSSPIRLQPMDLSAIINACRYLLTAVDHSIQRQPHRQPLPTYTMSRQTLRTHHKIIYTVERLSTSIKQLMCSGILAPRQACGHVVHLILRILAV